MLGQRVEPVIDLFHHAHHLPSGELGTLLVLGEVEAGERLAFLTDVTERAAHTECAREVAHHADDLHDGRGLRNHLDVDQRVGREVAGRLRSKAGRGGKDGNESEPRSHGAEGHSPLPFSHVSDAFATSFHPLSTVSE